MAGRERLTSALNGLKYACVALLYLGQNEPRCQFIKVLWPQLKIGLLLPNALDKCPSLLFCIHPFHLPAANWIHSAINFNQYLFRCVSPH